MSTDVPIQRCPCCDAELEAASWVSTGPGDTPARPKPGDITFCLYCAALLRFGQGLNLSQIPPAEADEIFAESPRLRRILAAIVETNRKRRQAARTGE